MLQEDRQIGDPETMQFARDFDTVEPEQAIDMVKVIKDWNLNKEQEWAFQIIVMQSLNFQVDPLHMFFTENVKTTIRRANLLHFTNLQSIHPCQNL